VAEAELIQCLSAEIALALRVSLLRGAPADSEPEGPGLVLFSTDCRSVDSMNGAAERWLHELSGELCEPLPHSICAVVQQARGARDGAAPAAISRLRTGKGLWLTVHGTQLGERVAVVLERGQPHEVASMVLSAHDLSPREGGVAQLLLRGMSNEDIALNLKISVYTVKDHIKAIFRKTGIASRSELGARLFAGQYLPRIARREPLAASGWFVSKPEGA
jgi:DNA-binding CsgD family transcriptional regulator